MLGGVIGVQQLEGHVLQPFLMGRLVRVHPLAVVVVIAIGGLVAGIFGALIAVPLTAIVNTVATYLAGERRTRLREQQPADGAAEAVPQPTPRSRRESDGPRGHAAGAGFAVLRRPAQRRQVHADQRARRREGRHHVEQAADDPTGRSRHRAPSRRPARRCWTPPACTGRARCWASGSTPRSAPRGQRSTSIGLCVPADEKVGPGDRFIARELAEAARGHRRSRSSPRPTGCGRRQVAEQLLAVAELGEAGHRVGRGGAGVRGGAASRPSCWPTCWRALVPESPPLYPGRRAHRRAGADLLVAELIREAALEGVRDELPHSIAVVVEEMLPREDRPADRPLLDVHAFLYVERDSQKAIVIGPKGARLREIGADRAPAHRGAARHPGLPRPAGHRGQGLAARPAAAAPPGLLGAWLWASGLPWPLRGSRAPAVGQ